ncbi:1,2-phenylacetyl-CoA epoxidase subunit PaaD [Haladaptatus cibarius]|uniref:1,2-phenylacetyl-CoA epoxidase subunit PaaD n=1 Tax=Haladaptatus cibarius TaxID=453847 RepID=UPI0006792E3B|nr:1,2-phenylacetyl-CoA epoxidase subunit PaaD [Haladaptatus cibarius]
MSNEPQAYETDSEKYDIESEPTACAYTDYSESGQSPEELPATGEGATGLEKRVWDALYDIEDPEMPISIVDLGLIYGVQMEGDSATVIMTLTYTGCPARKMLTEEIEEAVADVDGVEDADLELVWNPPWSIEMVTEQGKNDLRDFGLSI